MLIRLQPFYAGALNNKQCLVSMNNGKGFSYKYYDFLPDKDYTITDPVLKKFIRGQIGDVQEHLVASPDVIEQLRYYNVPYTTTKCSSCPSSVPRVVFNPFQILEDEEDDA